MDLHGHRIPIIKLWSLLLVPLQGEISDVVADELRRELLDRIQREGCSGLIIDITGLWVVDSHLCALLSKISNAASIMGSKTFVAGMKPEIALTLETMDIPLKGVHTTLDLERALELLGVTGPGARVERQPAAGASAEVGAPAAGATDGSRTGTTTEGNPA
ncbi:MAG: STAS domain-containing protein [Polyangiaceae bacterium]|nr:STAS domain-containing protein [Polyangiaceae bacterium]